MEKSDFLAKYDPKKICVATYRDRHRDLVKGVVLDGVSFSLSGNAIVYIDSFANPVLLEDIVLVEPTVNNWVY